MIVIGSDRCANASLIFVDMTVPGWDKDTTKYFTPYPECGGYRPGQWYTVGGESQLIGPICESKTVNFFLNSSVSYIPKPIQSLDVTISL